jgi:Fic family protein
VQNWIGGSNHSPRNALYVPPPPDTVKEYVDDLVRFTNRNGIPVLAQAPVAHAQFESIHPFTDGNGRIGRALVNTILRPRGATNRVVVPLASALVARRDHYFDVLNDYRVGRPEPIVAAFAAASRIAAYESRVTTRRYVP